MLLTLFKNFVFNVTCSQPTYDEIVGDENFSEEEKQLEKEDAFEAKYNFRFEEPNADVVCIEELTTVVVVQKLLDILKRFLAFVQIKTYPRTIADSVRRKEDKRSKKRREVKERKETVRCKNLQRVFIALFLLLTSLFVWQIIKWIWV